MMFTRFAGQAAGRRWGGAVLQIPRAPRGGKCKASLDAADGPPHPRPVLGTLRTIRRDLAAVASSFLGKSPTAVATITRPVRARPASSHAPRPMRVRRMARETADAVTLELEDPTGAPVAFAPGQFFTLHFRIDGETHKRAYSASSSALAPATVSVTIKRVDGGRVSSYAVDRVREGDAIDVLGPSGSFTPRPSASPRRLVLVGGGSGITPLASIVRTVLESEPSTRLALVYRNRPLGDLLL